jgi:hypothetical protein
MGWEARADRAPSQRHGYLSLLECQIEAWTIGFCASLWALERPNYNETFGASVVDPKTLAPVEARRSFVSGRGIQMCLVDSRISGMLMQLTLKVSGRTKFQSYELLWFAI